MPINTYDKGGRARLTANFYDADVLGDPTAVVLRIKDPAGTVTTPVPTHPSVGVYTHDLSLNAEGEWHYRFEGTGTIEAAAERVLRVRDSNFTP